MAEIGAGLRGSEKECKGGGRVFFLFFFLCLRGWGWGALGQDTLYCPPATLHPLLLPQLQSEDPVNHQRSSRREGWLLFFFFSLPGHTLLAAAMSVFIHS